MPALFILTLLSNGAAALFNPAIFSLPASLCGEQELPLLTAAIDACFSAATVIGPVLSALLYPWLGLRGLLAFNGVSYLLAAMMEAGIRLKASHEPPQSAPQLVPYRSTLDILRSDRLVAFVLGSFFMMNLALSPMLAFLPLFANQVFKGRIGTLASLEAALGIGTVVGSLALSVLHLKSKTGPRAIYGILVIATMYAAFSLGRDWRLACVFLVVLGLALSVVNVTMMSFFQSRPEPRDIPVVMSLVNLISVGVVPISMILVGGLIVRVDPRSLALSLALILGSLALGTALNPEFRNA